MKYKLNLIPIDTNRLKALVDNLSDDISNDEKINILNQITKMVHREVWRLTGLKIGEKR